MYESETGFYHLGSRYYDPEVGRFINADDTAVLTVSPMALTEKKLFAYCVNNPIMRADHNGQIWFAAMAIGAVAGAIISASVSAVTQYLETGDIGDINWKVVGINAATGAISGALATTGIGLGASVAVSSGLNTVNYIGEQLVTGQEISALGLGISVASGALGGLIAGKGMNAEGLRSTWITMQKGVNRWAQKAASKLAVKRMAFYSAEKTIIKKTVAVATGRFIASVVSNPVSSKKINMLYKRLG